MGIQSTTIPCKGGLNLAATNQELLSLPGQAIQLINMEPNKSGGYRRITGFAEWGSASLPGGVGNVKGIHTYLGGVVAAKGAVLYHSFDGTEWTQVNKLVDGVNQATLIAAPADAPFSTSNEVTFYMEVYTEGTVDHLYGTTGNGAPFYLKITGTSEATATYTYREVSLGTELIGAKYQTIFDDQVILANTTEDPSSFIYSSFATTDLSVAELAAGLTVREKYDGSTSGAISVKRPIVGIKEHKGSLFIFTDRTISAVQGLRNGNAQVIPVTDDVGCVDGNTIQEIGGDLVFLAPDGIRTIEQTARNNDVELGVISRKIGPLTDFIFDNIENMTFTSTVIREKNQYRLWYSNDNLVLSSQKAIIMSHSFDTRTGSFDWEFGEIEGWDPTVATSGEDVNKGEFLVHGDSLGKVYQFENGDTNFDGTKMRWIWQSPYTDFGDIGIRKTIHKVYVNLIAEGLVNAQLEIKYDYQRSDIPQPFPWILEAQTLPAIYGAVTYGDPLVLFGATTFGESDVNTEGSGFTVSFIIKDTDLDDGNFNIESLQVDFAPNGRI